MEKNIDEIFLLLEHRLDWILKELEGLEKLLIELFHANNANVESSSIEIRAERLRTLLSDLNDAACDWAQIETKLRESIISQLKSTSQQPGACPPSPIGEMERLLSLYTHFKRLQNRTQYLLFNVDLSVSIPTHNRLYINFLMTDPHEKPPAITGWFKKQGQKGFIKLWKRRFFMQKDTNLQYFTSECTHTTPKGILNMNTLIHVRPVLKENITNTQDNVLYLNTNVTEQLTCSTLMTTTTMSWLEVSLVRLTEPLTTSMTSLLQTRSYLLDCSITNLNVSHTANKSHQRNISSTSPTSTLYLLDLFMRWMRYIDTNELHKYRSKYHIRLSKEFHEVPPLKTENVPKDPLDTQLQTVQQQLSETEAAVRTLSSKVESLKQTLGVQERLRTLKLNEKIQTLRSTVTEQQKEITHLLNRLNECQQTLKMTDEKCMRTRLRVLMKKETLLMQQEEAKKLTEAISTYQRQKQTQEEHAAILHKEIEAQQQQLQENKTQSPRIKDSQILTEIISLRKQNQQQQHENEILSHQIQQVEERYLWRIRAREETCENLHHEYDVTRRTYEQTLSKILTEQGVDHNLIEELEELKRTYFFTLAVGLKLQNQLTGVTNSQVDLNTLYDEVEEQGIPRTQWTEWLTTRLTSNTFSNV